MSRRLYWTMIINNPRKLVGIWCNEILWELNNALCYFLNVDGNWKFITNLCSLKRLLSICFYFGRVGNTLNRSAPLNKELINDLSGRESFAYRVPMQSVCHFINRQLSSRYGQNQFVSGEINTLQVTSYSIPSPKSTQNNSANRSDRNRHWLKWRQKRVQKQ